MQKNLTPFLATAVSVLTVAAILAVTYLVADKYLGLELAKARYQAVDSCFKTASVNTRRVDKDDNNKELNITEPVRDIYTYCMQDKGIEVTKIK